MVTPEGDVGLDVLVYVVVLDEGVRLFYDKDALVLIVADLVVDDPCHRPSLYSDAGLLVVLDGCVVHDYRIVVVACDQDTVLEVISDLVYLDARLADVVVEGRRDHALPAVSDAVPVDERVCTNDVEADFEVLDQVQEELGLRADSDLDSDSFLIATDDGVLFYENGLLVLFLPFLLVSPHRADDFDVERQIAYEFVAANPAEGVLRIVDQQATADVVVDVALLDDQVRVARDDAESRVNPLSLDVHSYELARGSLLQHDCGQGGVVLALDEVQTEDGVLGKTGLP